MFEKNPSEYWSSRVASESSESSEWAAPHVVVTFDGYLSDNLLRELHKRDMIEVSTLVPHFCE
jgi:hypothetical protein